MATKSTQERREERAAQRRTNRHNYFMAEITAEPDPRRRVDHVVRFIRALADDMTPGQLDQLADQLTDVAQGWAAS